MESQNIKEQLKPSKEQLKPSKEQLKPSKEWIEQIGNDMRCSCGGIFSPHMKIEIIEGRTYRKDTAVVYECDKCHTSFER